MTNFDGGVGGIPPPSNPGFNSELGCSRVAVSTDKLSLTRKAFEKLGDALQIQGELPTGITKVDAFAWNHSLLDRFPDGDTAVERLENLIVELPEVKTHKLFVCENPLDPSKPALNCFVERIDPSHKDWEGFRDNFVLHSPESFKDPKLMYVLRYSTSDNPEDFEAYVLVGQVTDQGAAYVGNITTENTGWSGTEVLYVWEAMMMEVSPSVTSLQDTAHIPRPGGADLVPRLFFPIVRADGKSYYERTGYEFCGQTIDVKHEAYNVSPERLRDAFKALQDRTVGDVWNSVSTELKTIIAFHVLAHGDEHLTPVSRSNVPMGQVVKWCNNISAMGDSALDTLIEEVEAVQRALGLPENELSTPSASLSEGARQQLEDLGILLDGDEQLIAAFIQKMDDALNFVGVPYRDLHVICDEYIMCGSTDDAKIVAKCDEFHKSHTAIRQLILTSKVADLLGRADTGESLPPVA